MLGAVTKADLQEQSGVQTGGRLEATWSKLPKAEEAAARFRVGTEVNIISGAQTGNAGIVREFYATEHWWVTVGGDKDRWLIPEEDMRITGSTTRGPTAEATSTEASLSLPDTWVVKWVDYSNKYGVGYLLSDGSIGVFYNDSTKVILMPEGSQFDYITRRMRDRPETRSTHSFEDYPEDLKKKVTLLRHFRSYMLADTFETRDGASLGVSGLPAPTKSHHITEPGQLCFVKKWTKNKSAIMFQLSNKVVQTVFSDNTETVLSSQSRMVTYVNKKGHVSSHPLSNVQEVSSPDFAKRLRYTKDILLNMLGPHD